MKIEKLLAEKKINRELIDVTVIGYCVLDCIVWKRVCVCEIEEDTVWLN